MLRNKHLFWLTTVLAFTSISCAPHDSTTPPNLPSGSEDAGGTEIKPPKPLPDLPKHLQARIDAALANVRNRSVEQDLSFWTIFHAILGIGPENTYLVDPRTQQRVKAIDYIRQGGRIRGMEFFETPNGLDVRTMAGTGVGQGHQDQFIAEMAQWGLLTNTKFHVNGKDYTFKDFINHSKARVRVTGKDEEKQELSWAIIIVGEYFYVGTDIHWQNSAGETVAFTDVVRYELNEPIIECRACGGTHRLFGLTWVYHRHLEHGGKKVGVWKDVEAKIAEFKNLARTYQNRDGSFSTNFFRGPGNDRRDTNLRVNTTGHILEWLALALSDAELREPWVENAVNALVLMILENRNRVLDGGSLYHAAHGLAIYRARVFGPDGSHTPVIPLPPRP
jgi:hypothetical protein